MADYNHRRAASELLAYRQVAGGAVYVQDRLSVSQRPGSAGTLFAHPTPRGHHMVDQNGSKYANTNFHYRSQSYENPCSWDAYVEEARKRKQHKFSDIKLHSSYGSPVNLSPPEGMSSKAGLATQALPPSPSKVPNQTFVPGRTARARAFSHSAPKGFQNTVIESSVPEEDEQIEAARNWNKAHQNNASHGNMVKQPALPYVGMTEDEAKAVSNLRQRRQQRQLKIAGKPHSKQPGCRHILRHRQEHSRPAGLHLSSGTLPARHQ
ncbi:hypothetical protein SPBR_06070 [Sporothrix brasiliensis 5110]|uniref:Uncharacterized protein n=1 Tax=Sporothrix brasiliensis 5110 TaxID=1398154 RepID=A0A0C2J008_9PEZI|nr:uncharacterized protein SPBR_06070 [Sporothrix brasiliensis 5110]KIH94661.1 hypothetical protein SPBR_06070 [Sporothrix brasiliensis 5110]